MEINSGPLIYLSSHSNWSRVSVHSIAYDTIGASALHSTHISKGEFGISYRMRHPLPSMRLVRIILWNVENMDDLLIGKWIFFLSDI